MQEVLGKDRLGIGKHPLGNTAKKILNSNFKNLNENLIQIITFPHEDFGFMRSSSVSVDLPHEQFLQGVLLLSVTSQSSATDWLFCKRSTSSSSRSSSIISSSHVSSIAHTFCFTISLVFND